MDQMELRLAARKIAELEASERHMLERLKRDFAVVKHAKPPSSRKDSSELYVIATGFRGPAGKP